jgi:hypothetical protein
MRIEIFFSEALGIKEPVNASALQGSLPTCLELLYVLNKQLPESILKTDVRILERNELYQVGEFTVFAEESQCVVLWAFQENEVPENCYAIVSTDPLRVFPEDCKLAETLLALVVSNSLSSVALTHFEYLTLPNECLDGIIKRFGCVGEVSKLKAIVSDGVACTIQQSSSLFLSAASLSKEKLQHFTRQIEKAKGFKHL